MNAQPFERVNYFAGEYLTKDDFVTEQNYYINKSRTHNRYLHSWGIVQGLEVEKETSGSITVSPGMAIDGLGREIVLYEQKILQVAGGDADANDAGHAPKYVTISYNEERAEYTSQQNGKGFKRVVENPRIAVISPLSSNPSFDIYLATITIDQGLITDCSTEHRRSAGSKMPEIIFESPGSTDQDAFTPNEEGSELSIKRVKPEGDEGQDYLEVQSPNTVFSGDLALPQGKLGIGAQPRDARLLINQRDTDGGDQFLLLIETGNDDQLFYVNSVGEVHVEQTLDIGGGVKSEGNIALKSRSLITSPESEPYNSIMLNDGDGLAQIQAKTSAQIQAEQSIQIQAKTVEIGDNGSNPVAISGGDVSLQSAKKLESGDNYITLSTRTPAQKADESNLVLASENAPERDAPTPPKPQGIEHSAGDDRHDQAAEKVKLAAKEPGTSHAANTPADLEVYSAGTVYLTGEKGINISGIGLWEETGTDKDIYYDKGCVGIGTNEDGLISKATLYVQSKKKEGAGGVSGDRNVEPPIALFVDGGGVEITQGQKISSSRNSITLAKAEGEMLLSARDALTIKAEVVNVENSLSIDVSGSPAEGTKLQVYKDFNGVNQVENTAQFTFTDLDIGTCGVYFSVKNGGDNFDLILAEYGGTKVWKLAQDGTAYKMSDTGAAQDIQPIEDGLGKVRQLRGISYRPSSNDSGDRRTVGLLAGEVEKILPELVHTDENGGKSLAYGELGSVLVEAVKELDGRLNELEQAGSGGLNKPEQAGSGSGIIKQILAKVFNPKNGI